MMNDESVHLSTKIDLSVPVTDNNNHIYDDSNNSNSKLLEEKDDLMERLDLLENIQRHEEKSGICNFDSNTSLPSVSQIKTENRSKAIIEKVLPQHHLIQDALK